MNDETLRENGNGAGEGVLRFESLDTGDAVLAYACATSEGRVSLLISHEMDGDLELFMNSKTVDELALRLAAPPTRPAGRSGRYRRSSGVSDRRSVHSSPDVDRHRNSAYHDFQETARKRSENSYARL
jgi:hypothetical protein